MRGKFRLRNVSDQKRSEIKARRKRKVRERMAKRSRSRNRRTK